MCGIAGLASKDKIKRDDIVSMTGSLSHRGPDAMDVFVNGDGTIALGHTRLSVIDLSARANQPMFSSDGRYCIVFNGEIYNFRSLKAELGRLNKQVTFRTNSDTEVILQGFIQWGGALCEKLEGMFAFGIYDSLSSELFLCRDRVGKKPLYYFGNDALFAFASELKSLLRHPSIARNRSIDYDAIYTFLHVGYIPEPQTSYTAIRKFPAGHYAYVQREGRMRLTRYHNLLPDLKDINQKIDYKVGDVKSVLIEAVQKRLISDVPLGAFLSGGTDSSLIVAMAAKLKTDIRLKTFSIGFTESQFDETAYARDVAAELNTDHREYRLSQTEAVGLLETYLTHFDEPFADTSAIPTMLVSRLAKEEVTVALTGDGGDELFLGYGAYDWANRLDQYWVSLLQSPLSKTLKSIGGNRLKRLGYLLEHVKPRDVRSHIFSQEQYLFTKSEIKSMAVNSNVAFTALVYSDPQSQLLNAAEKQALFDMQYYLKDDLLVKLDRASMYYGLECRCPFLDPQVIQLALALPYQMKRRSKQRKWILKEILKEYLPERLVYRPKWGFSIPLAHWMRHELAYLSDRYLSKPMIEDIGVVSYEQVHKLKTAFSKGEDFLYNRLWVLIVAHKWLSENAR